MGVDFEGKDNVLKGTKEAPTGGDVFIGQSALDFHVLELVNDILNGRIGLRWASMLLVEVHGIGNRDPVFFESSQGGKNLMTGHLVNFSQKVRILLRICLQALLAKGFSCFSGGKVLETPFTVHQAEINPEADVSAGVPFFVNRE